MRVCGTCSMCLNRYTMAEFRRQPSRMWWPVPESPLGSPLPHPPHMAISPAAALGSPLPPIGSPLPALAVADARDSSSSPSTSHKSHDSGFSDSEGSSPASSSGSNNGNSGTASPEQPNPVASLPRCASADDARLCRSQCAEESDDATPLNRTFPMTGPSGAQHRAIRSFLQDRARRRAVPQQPPRTHPEGEEAVSRETREESVTVEQKTVQEITVVAVKEVGLEEIGDLEALTLLGAAVGPLLDLTGPPGLPAHTSTPKALQNSTPKSAPGSTPIRSQQRPGERRAVRSVNLFGEVSRTFPPSREEVEQPRQPAPPALPTTGPVAAWLIEISRRPEQECTSQLQSKTLLGGDAAALRQLECLRQLRLGRLGPAGLRKLQVRADGLASEYASVARIVRCGQSDSPAALAASVALAERAEAFVDDYATDVEVEAAAPVRKACSALRAHPPTAGRLVELRSALAEAVDALLDRQVCALVAILESPASSLAQRAALSAVTALGRQGPVAATLLARRGGVRALLGALIDARNTPTRRAALRALSALCCCAPALQSLHDEGGVEVLAELLAEPAGPRSEGERSEAAGLLAQATAPWLEDATLTAETVTRLGRHLPTVTTALVALVDTAVNDDALLLTTAALAHLTGASESAVWPLLESRAADAVVRAVRRRGSAVSVFLQEQAASLLAAMTVTPEARSHLVACSSVPLLLCVLQLRPSPLARAPEASSAGRAQMNAAVGLSRLSGEPEAARQVLELRGIDRLVRLCRDPRERAHRDADAVLVACLATLRKIAANVGTAALALSPTDRRELLTPRLRESFELLAVRQESYV